MENFEVKTKDISYMPFRVLSQNSKRKLNSKLILKKNRIETKRKNSKHIEIQNIYAHQFTHIFHVL